MCTTVCIRGFSLHLSFYLEQESSSCSRYGFSCYTFTYFAPIGVMEERVIKINSKDFNEKL